jgi:glycerol-3-phosphate dehydrogenase
LVKPSGSARTSAISRDHTIVVSDAGLVTITGGKWTTYRKMAEDVVDWAVEVGDLERHPCTTQDLALHGAVDIGQDDRLRVYGADASGIQELERGDAALADPLGERVAVTGAQVVWAAREEMARTVEDMLARRTRALFLDAEDAAAMAPAVARLLAAELTRDAEWESAQVTAFRDLASGYLIR